MTQDDGLPLALSVTVGSGLFGGWQARWDGDRLVYDRLGAGFAREAQDELWPRADDWRRFWERLDEAGVWEWEPRYEAAGAEAEPAWELRVARPGRRAETRGRGAFPGGSERSREWTAMLDAVRGLLGGREFGAIA